MRGSDYYITNVGSQIMHKMRGEDEIVMIKIILDDSVTFNSREQVIADVLERSTLIGKLEDLPVRR